MILEVLIIAALAIFCLFVVDLSCLRLMSKKCPYCHRYTVETEGRSFRCCNGHCNSLFTDQREQSYKQKQAD